MGLKLMTDWLRVRRATQLRQAATPIKFDFRKHLPDASNSIGKVNILQTK